jgi:hypothetical protein
VEVLFHFVVLLDVSIPSFFVVLGVSRENFVEVRVVSFIQMIGHEVTVPLMGSGLGHPVFFSEHLDLAIEFRPPDASFFFVNEVADEVRLAEAIKTHFPTVADRFACRLERKISVLVHFFESHRGSFLWAASGMRLNDVRSSLDQTRKVSALWGNFEVPSR